MLIQFDSATFRLQSLGGDYYPLPFLANSDTGASELGESSRLAGIAYISADPTRSFVTGTYRLGNKTLDFQLTRNNPRLVLVPRPVELALELGQNSLVLDIGIHILGNSVKKSFSIARWDEVRLGMQQLESQARPSYSDLDAHYPSDDHPCPDISPSPNQCAVRVSRALAGAGQPIESAVYAPHNLCRHNYARGAQDLAAYLKKQWGLYDHGSSAPSNVPAAIQGKNGVIVFMNIPNFDGQGHIDLWNGNQTRTGEYWNADPIWFWKLS